MLARVYSATVHGLEVIRITIEVDIANRGLPGFQVVGLPSKSIDEARVRVIAAIKNSGFAMPQKRVTVNLAPADLKKDGSLFDLPIALCVLAADSRINVRQLENSLFIGELSLNGDVMGVAGAIPIILNAQKWGVQKVFIPFANSNEVNFLDNSKDFELYGVTSLIDLADHLRYAHPLRIISKKSEDLVQHTPHVQDVSSIKGQHQAKRALEIAAAGEHNVQLVGPPGTGKTMLAHSIPTILPNLTKEEKIEVASISSITRARYVERVKIERPFRSPHHSISLTGMIGGGASLRPGEISLAHRGVLFLDEFPEFSRTVIESLRQPLEDRNIVLTKAGGSVKFPAHFMLVAASNPCICGFQGHPTKECTCTAADILRYRKKISGPILDRIDIHVAVPFLFADAITAPEKSEDSASIRKRVEIARQIQQKRFKNLEPNANAEMTSEHIGSLCNLSKSASSLLKEAFTRLSLSTRGYFAVIKIAQTIADLRQEQTIQSGFIAEALQYRYLEQ